MDTDLEEFEDGGRIELTMQKQLEDSRKRRPDIQENGEKKRSRFDIAEGEMTPVTSEWTSSSSSSEYSDSDSDAEEVEPQQNNNKVDKSETETQDQSQDFSSSAGAAAAMPKPMSPRTLNRELLKAVNLDEISDLSSMSSFTSDELTERAPPRHIEFEVASMSPVNENPIENSSSSSGSGYELEDEEQVELQELVTKSDSEDWSQNDEFENFADEESDSSSDDFTKKSLRSSGLSSDSELSDRDVWYCTQCNVKTNKPYLRYCLRCFRIRRNWLPKRPKSRKSKPRRNVEKQKRGVKHDPHSLEDSSSEDVEPTSTPEDPKDSSFSQSFIFSSSQESNKEEKQQDLNLSHKLQYILDAPPLRVNKTRDSRPESEKDVGICSICMVRDKNAGFVHGKIAHIYSCYVCADKILKKSGKCPICRKKILRVVKIIDV